MNQQLRNSLFQIETEMNTAIESFWIVLINERSEIIGYTMLNEGDVDFVDIDYRKLVKTVINVDECVEVVISHNHPSGCVIPSKSDCLATKKIKLLLNEIQVDLIDHVIITDNSHYSFKANGGM